MLFSLAKNNCFDFTFSALIYILKSYWMRHSVDLMKKISNHGLHVAAIIVSYDNVLLCYGVSGDSDNESWCSMLFRRIIELKISKAKSIYLTTNTLSQNNSFDLNSILKRVCIEEIYIGLPDPSLCKYVENDPVLGKNQTYRFTLELQQEIFEHNKHFYIESRQCIKNTPYFYMNRISNLVAEKLRLQGIILTKEEVDSNKSSLALSMLISEKYRKKNVEVYLSAKKETRQELDEKNFLRKI